VRYSLVSVVSVAVSQSVLAVAFGVLHWTAQLANVVACAVAAVPSFHLNRSWAWGRRGRSHAAASHAETTAIVMASSLLAFGLLRIGKFAIFNVLLFTERR
jgi:putative flippase GtrA